MAGGRVDEVADNVFAVSSRINSTWGGNLTDMVRSRRILEVIEADGLLEHAAEAGRYLLGRLEELAAEFPTLVLDPRGRGLMCAFSMPTAAQRDRLVGKLWDRRVIMLASGPDSVRFRPALTVTRDGRSTQPSTRCARAQLTRRRHQPADRRAEPSQVLAADEHAAVQFGEFACGGREVVIGDHHGVRAVVHRGTGDHLLHGACADRSGLPLALNGKAIRPAAHDEVDARSRPSAAS